MSPLEITLVILLVTIIAFVSGKVPFSVISTGIILALILTGIKTPAEAFGGFINTNVVMFVAMFVIGAGLTKTPLIQSLSRSCSTVYGTPVPPTSSCSRMVTSSLFRATQATQQPLS